MQWMNRTAKGPLFCWYIDERMEQQQWNNGWYDIKDSKFYFQKRPLLSTDVPFTNVLSREPIPKKNIFLFGFDLRDDKTLPEPVGKIGLAKYRDLLKQGIKMDTYENPKKITKM
jgi:hypothetical protein